VPQFGGQRRRQAFERSPRHRAGGDLGEDVVRARCTCDPCRFRVPSQLRHGKRLVLGGTLHPRLDQQGLTRLPVNAARSSRRRSSTRQRYANRRSR
jgi:hypothetical protein